ncbi:MAG TPA: hypothetical protein VFR66_07785 [Burkholderiales bacterium]|nr:hypothetical protein [Burkholderiales bacterium]
MRAARLALLVVVAGCSAVQPLVNPVDAIVADAMTAARAPASEQAAALARAEKEVTNTGGGSPADRLRLATLLATLPPPLRDDARAAELLAPLADSNAVDIGHFAALLDTQISERQRALRELERISREAERAARERERIDKERAQLEKERERLDKERDKREEGLKQQLEALRAIERGILEREEDMRRKQK